MKNFLSSSIRRRKKGDAAQHGSRPEPSTPLPLSPVPIKYNATNSAVRSAIAVQAVVSEPVSPHPATPSPSTVAIRSDAGEASQTQRGINQPESLWDKAYGNLRAHEPKLVDLYERILSHSLGPSGGTENLIASADEGERQSQMGRLLDTGLAKTEKLAKVDKNIGDAINIVLSVKNPVGEALQAVPVAAAAWAGVCVALQVFLNPVNEMPANRDGIVQVVRTMKWYLSLSKILLDDKEANLAEIREHVADRILDLYKTLLKYIMKSICAYNRHPALTTLRDTVKLDDWKGHLTEVVKAEDNVKAAADVFGVQKANSYLGLLVNMHRSKEQGEIVQNCFVTDMTVEIESLQARKDLLLTDSYKWILETQEYKAFVDWDDHSSNSSGAKRLLWVKGDAGKGKTMLVMGVVRELTSQLETHLDAPNLSYFFCQGTNDKLNTATAIVKGLIWMLLRQERSLARHLQEMFRDGGSDLFMGRNAFYSLKRILRAMLTDPALTRAYLVVDALDECRRDEPGLPQLLDLIADLSRTCNKARWLVSSRRDTEIEEVLANFENAAGTHTNTSTILSLELNSDSVADAVEAYIGQKMADLAQTYQTRYAKTFRKVQGRLQEVQDSIAKEVRQKANGTFLWVALVFKQMEGCGADQALDLVRTIPPGLDAIYGRMVLSLNLGKHSNSSTAEQCKAVLLLMVNAYRPLGLAELASLASLSDLTPHEDVVNRCGFLTIKEGDNTVFFVHQSAKDYLLNDGTGQSNPLVFDLFPDGHAEGHQNIVLRSLKAMSTTLRRDIYNLQDFSLPIDEIRPPVDNPLFALEYTCFYWIRHLCEVGSQGFNCEAASSVLYENVDSFFKEHFLHWIESLSLLHKLPDSIKSIQKLLQLVRNRRFMPKLTRFLEDAERFVLSYRSIMERHPLQIYAAALIFCPVQTEIKRLFWVQRCPFIKAVAGVAEFWDPCRQVLEGYSNWIDTVAFSPDGKSIASGFEDGTVWLWDASTGAHRQTFVCKYKVNVNAIAFSSDSKTIAFAFRNGAVWLWDIETGAHREVRKCDDSITITAFSPDAKIMASALEDLTLRLWDVTTNTQLKTLEGNTHRLKAVTISPDSKTVVSASIDGTVRLWDTVTGAHWEILEDSNVTTAAAFSPNSKTIALPFTNCTIWLWDAVTGIRERILKGNCGWVTAIAFSPDGTVLASASDDRSVSLWDAETGACLTEFEGHENQVNAIAFSPDSKTLASAANDGTVRLWDTTIKDMHHQGLNGFSGYLRQKEFSPDGSMLLSTFDWGSVQLWNTMTGTYRNMVHNELVCMSIAFSPDNMTVAAGLGDSSVRIWDTTTVACLHRLEGCPAHSLFFSPSGKTLICASEGGTGQLRDTATGVLLRTLDTDQLASEVAFVDTGHDQGSKAGRMSVTGDGWVNRDGKNLFRLPYEYRSQRSVCRAGILALGLPSGRVVFVHLADIV